MPRPDQPPTFTPTIPGLPGDPPKVIEVTGVAVTIMDNGFVIDGTWLLPDEDLVGGHVPRREAFSYVANTSTEVRAFMNSVFRDERPDVH